MRPAVRYLVLFALLASLLLGGVAFANWRIDPWQFYRQASYPPYFGDQPRWQNPGLARHYPYDTVILGTSVSLGYDLDQVGRTLAARPLNLAMQGAAAREQRLLLEVALRSGHPRRVIWDLNYEFFRGQPDWVATIDGAFPSFLYDTDPWNELPNYLWNVDVLKSTTRIALRRYPRQRIEELSQSRRHRPPGFDSVKAAFTKARAGDFIFRTRPAEFAPGLALASFRENCRALLAANPKVQFDLHFPPFSIAYHALVRDVNPAAFEDMLAWKRAIAAEVAALPNVRLFDFQGVPEIVTDFRRYNDTVHFDAATHAELISSIQNQRHVATAETLAASEAFLRGKANGEWGEGSTSNTQRPTSNAQ